MGQKDLSEKILFDYNDVFADIINVLLFHGEQVVRPNELENHGVHSQYKADNNVLHEEERDVVKKWVVNGIQLSICGIENQTAVEHGMPLRLIGYDGASYRSQLLDKKKNRYVPVVTLVLNFSDHPWNAPKTLKAALDIPDGWGEYVSDYKINVFDIAWLSVEQVEMFKSDFGIVADFFVRKRRDKSYVPSQRVIQHVDEVLKLLSVMSGDRRYEEVSLTKKGGQNTMCEILQSFIDKGIEQGVEQGMKRGIQQGMERGIEQGMERGIEQGIERGIEQGVEKGIFVQIDTLKEFGVSDAEIPGRISQKFGVDPQSAHAYLERYLNR